MSLGLSWSRGLALALAMFAVVPPAWAQDGGDDEEEEDEGDDEDEETGDEEEDAGDDDEEEEDTGDDEEEEAATDKEDGDTMVLDTGTQKTKPAAKKDEFVKQNLSGHDLGTNKAANPFERDRFFIDKVDTKDSAKGTLVQGSLASSTMYYTESGGPLRTENPIGDNTSRFRRFFTDLRLQTEFRHISQSSWSARVDARARMVNTPPDCVQCVRTGKTGDPSVDQTRIQSGFNGTNEYELRELWLLRQGKQTDFYVGRQYILDLGALRFDGVRFDYAKSKKLTVLGFGGLYPVRGSRSLTTDYVELKKNDGTPVGRFVGAAGAGVAYRTDSAYGSVGGAALVPFAGESPRVFVTSTGYWRNGNVFDIYHFALVDLISQGGETEASKQTDTSFAVTNLSVGLNYRPAPRLRIYASANRVDVDTLNVQANAFLGADQNSPNIVQNETFFRRLATNAGRLGVSGSLGELQRFEISTSVTFRMRDGVTLTSPDGMTTATLDPTKGIDVWAALVDRRSLADMRLGVEGSNSFPIGKVPFERANVFTGRLFAGREFSKGRGEWEADFNVTKTTDRNSSGVACDRIMGTDFVDARTCLGSSTGTMFGLGATFYYRFSRDWFGFFTFNAARQSLTVNGTGMPVADPPTLGLLGFLRIAYRF
jgi:hypothetical protein